MMFPQINNIAIYKGSNQLIGEKLINFPPTNTQRITHKCKESSH